MNGCKLVNCLLFGVIALTGCLPAIAGMPPVGIHLTGAAELSERHCTGPFRATLRGADGGATPTSAWTYFWVELEGAAPEWTTFYEDAGCGQRVRTYIDNTGDGRTKARLDFQPGVAEREFYLLTKKLSSDRPVVSVAPRAGGGTRWRASLALATVPSPSAAPSVAPGVSQASLARAAQLGPLHAVNDWRARKSIVERFDIDTALPWREELIVRSERLANLESACTADETPECDAGTGFLSALSLKTGEVRRLRSWSLDEDGAVGSARSLVRERISGDRLLLQYGRDPARLAIVDLTSGETIESPPLPHSVEDFAVHGEHLVVSYFELLKRAGSPYQERSYSAAFFRLTDFEQGARIWTGTAPVVTDEALYSIVAGFTNGDRSKVIVTEHLSDGSKGVRFEGEWPSPSSDCRQSRPDRVIGNDRFYLEMNRCGEVRGIDFQARRLFELPQSLEEQFEAPELHLSQGHLLIQGRLKNANRGAGDSGRPLYAYDLAAQRWRGRLQLGDYVVRGATGDAESIALTLTRGCGNRYGSGQAARVLRAPAVLRRLELLAEEEIGSRGAEIADAFRDAMARGRLDRLDRFGEDAAGLRELLARLPSPPTPASVAAGEAVGSLGLGNSERFRERLQYPQPLPLSAAAEMSYACEFLDVPTYERPGGEQAGWMSLTIRPGPVEGPVADGWLANLGRQIAAPAPVVYRDKWFPTLPVYATAADGWVRLTPATADPVWVNLDSLPSDLSASLSGLGESGRTAAR